MILKRAFNSVNLSTLIKLYPNVAFLQVPSRYLSEAVRSYEIRTNKQTVNQTALDSQYCQPDFFKYFNIFLTDNGFRRNVSHDLLFQYKQALEEFGELHEIVQHSNSSTLSAEDAEHDKDFSELAKSETELLIRQLTSLQVEILSQAVVDDRDVNECTFEIRAGVGGKEASIFAEELFRLYSKFIDYNGWDIRVEPDQFEQVNIDDNSSLSTSTVEVSGQFCYKMLRHEAGVHRVQRVPKTEKYGRIHTSTVSISVIPVRQNLVVVKDSDLKFEVKNSSGAGGQNVNRNLTCVRCTHIPSGLAVESQETRFQYLNKDIAIRKLKALLNQQEYDRLEKEARQHKRLQVGIAARSDKIRTYNYPQNRITDHRLSGEGSNLFNISGYMAGEECDKMCNVIERLETTRHNELIKQVRTALEQGFLKSIHKAK